MEDKNINTNPEAANTPKPTGTTPVAAESATISNTATATAEPSAQAAAAPVAPAVAPAPRRSRAFTYVAIVLVLVALLAVLFRLEREGRVDTNLFGGVIAMQEAAAVVAIVNGEELRGQDLELSIEQLTQAARAQQINPEDPAVATDITSQATDMLINSTLLQQQAAEEGIEITEVQVNERILELENAAGGADVLAQRMAEFDIDRDTFEADIKTELTITTLLDAALAEADLTVSEEEIVAVYERAGGGTEAVPPLAEVRQPIEEQIRANKENAFIESYLADLRAAADIEIIE